MKFLDDIAELKSEAEKLRADIADALNAKEQLSNTLGDAARQLAEVQQQIANAPRPFTVEIKQNGDEFVISEKDGLVLLAALTRALDGEEVSVKLASGQTPKLKLTDLEQIATKILEALQ